MKELNANYFNGNDKEYSEGHVFVKRDHTAMNKILFVSQGFVMETWDTERTRKRGRGQVLGLASLVDVNSIA